MIRQAAYPVDFHAYIGKKIYMIGIGGSSMSGIARILQAKGCKVSGSDMLDGENVQELRKAGVSVTVGHAAENVIGADLAVYSMAIPEDHIELAACRRLGIPTIERSVLLGQLTREFQTVVAVCGTHGKTTTTSMLAQMLVDAGTDPSVHIGGVLDSIGGSIRYGGSEIFLTEACEYRRNFMNLSPTAAVLLNIDRDHLDCYRDIDEIESAFGDFLQLLPNGGWALGNSDDERVRRRLQEVSCPYYTFGETESSDYRMVSLEEDRQGCVSFELLFRQRPLGQVQMAVPGVFNARNALAALAAAHRLGLDMAAACETVGSFHGAHRRFELTGTLNGAELFHDYGHNPAEMRNAVSIARKRCRDGRLWAVMQPHTYSRVKTLFDDYLTCTEEADITLVTDIFAAREVDPGDISAAMLVEGMKKHGVNAVCTPSFDDAAKAIREGVQAGDLVITLGCGNIYRLNELVKEVKPDGTDALNHRSGL